MGEPTVSLRTRVTVAFIVVCAPFVVWAVRTDAKVDQLQYERAEMRADLKDIQRSLQDIRDRLPPRERGITYPKSLPSS